MNWKEEYKGCVIRATPIHGPVKFIDGELCWTEDIDQAARFESDEEAFTCLRIIYKRRGLRKRLDRIHFVSKTGKFLYTWSNDLKFRFNMRQRYRRAQAIREKIKKVLTPAEMKCIKVEIPYEHSD